MLKYDWCRNHLCEDEDGNEVFQTNNPRAKSFCLMGYIYKSNIDCPITIMDYLRTNILDSKYDGSLVNWNDEVCQSKDECIAFIDKAIAQLQERTA